MVTSNWIRISNRTNGSASVESSRRLCCRVKTAHQLSQNWMATDTLTRVYSNTLSHHWSTMHKANIRIQVPWISHRWKSLTQKALHVHAPKVRKNSAILKYVTRSKTLSVKARNLICQVFIQPYLQMIYAVWPLLSCSSMKKIEAENWQLSRRTHNW